MKKRKEIELMARGVYVSGGKLLVCHTRGASNTYLPGGHIEFGESAKQSLCREIGEELGRRAEIGPFLGAIEHRYRQKGAWHCEVNLVFAMRIAGLAGRQMPASREAHLDFRWIPLASLARSDLEPAPLRRLLAAWRRKGIERWSSTIAR